MANVEAHEEAVAAAETKDMCFAHGRREGVVVRLRWLSSVLIRGSPFVWGRTC